MSRGQPRPEDAKLAIMAKIKLENDEKPTQQEVRALKRYEAALREEAGKAFLRAVPQKQYLGWAGQSRGVVGRQAALHGIPLEGSSISIPEVIGWLHGFLAESSRTLHDEPTRPSIQSVEDEARLLKARADLQELKRDEQLGDLIRRDQFHDVMMRWAAVIRKAGDRLGKKFGPDAQDVLNEALDTCESVIDELAIDR